MNVKRYIIASFIILLCLGAAGAYWGYRTIYESKDLWNNSEVEEKVFYIPTGTKYEQWKENLLDSFPLLDEFWVETLSERMNVKTNIHPGRYVIPRNISLHALVNKFRNGTQDPVDVVIPVKWTLSELARIVSNQIESDSMDIITHLQSWHSDSMLPSVNTYSLIIPNTYEFYWNTSGKAFAERMGKEAVRFWQRNDRLQKASSLGLTPHEVYTLASIVYRETNHKDEMPLIAGVYLNRLERGIALQADPTVKFSVGDLGLRRILKKHLSYDSPYNTYLYPGLPPGPISMTDINSIDAVLNASTHDYLYFCARPDSSGKHAFSESYNAHLVNARKFHKWLNQRNIR